MNKRILFVLGCIVFSMANISCQKEDDGVVAEQAVESRCVNYSINGIQFQIFIQNEEQFKTLMNRLLELCEQGCTVSVWDENTYQNIGCKITETFEHENKEVVNEWATKMSEDGYRVTIKFDYKRKIYVGIAVK